MFESTLLDTLRDSDRAFLQHRVSRFGLVAGATGVMFTLFLAVTGLYQGSIDDTWLRAVGLFVLGTICFLGMWAATAWGERSLPVIRAAETVGLLGAALAFNLSMMSIAHVGRPDYIVLLTLFSALIGRAIYIPSSPRRSLFLAALIGAETLAAIYWTYLSIDAQTWALVLVEDPQWQVASAQFTPERIAQSMTVNAAAWWFVVMFMTSAASHVIFGLRREARKAKQLGQYHLDGKLGEGGMGIVYKAHHALLRRPTAIKLLLPEKAGERSIERFEREVRLMARLRHPNTVTVFDYGRSPDGVFYYAMEYIDGATLGEVVDLTGPMEPARAIAVMSGAASAMIEAHGVGLIHRDIKPANLMVYLPHPHGIEESVKVLDFGLVKDITTGDAGTTKAGMITGTPQYMAPEAIINPESVDGRSDVYALGCVLFFLLTGEHVFDGGSAMEVCAKHLHEAPDRIADRTGRATNEKIEALVADCMAKDPASRPATARALRERLHEISDLGTFSEHDASEWWDEYGDMLKQELAPMDRKLTMDMERAITGPDTL